MGFWLTSKSVKIPFEIVNNSLFLKVNLNEYKGLSFIVDTGSNYSIVFTDSLIRLPTQNKSIAVLGFGSTDSLSAKVSIGNTLAIKGLVTQGKQLLAIEKSKIRLQQFYDRPIHGVIGLDMLRHYDVEINFQSGKLILKQDGLKPKSGKGWKRIPFELRNNALIVPARVSGKEDQDESIFLLLDTGSDMPLLLQQKFCPPESKSTIIGMGILGYASGKVGVIKKVTLGEFEINNISVAFPDSASSKWNSNLSQNGNLGFQFLKRYRVAIDYKEQYIWLKAVNKYAHRPFPYNRTGIAIETSGTGKCAYYISQVAPGSPAQIAGVLKDDKLMSISYTPCSSLTLRSINDYFFNTKISKLEITVQRGIQLITYKMDLREF